VSAIEDNILSLNRPVAAAIEAAASAADVIEQQPQPQQRPMCILERTNNFVRRYLWAITEAHRIVACLHIHTFDSNKNQSIEAYLSIFIHLKNNKHNRYNSDNHSSIWPGVTECVFAHVTVCPTRLQLDSSNTYCLVH